MILRQGTVKLLLKFLFFPFIIYLKTGGLAVSLVPDVLEVGGDPLLLRVHLVAGQPLQLPNSLQDVQHNKKFPLNKAQKISHRKQSKIFVDSVATAQSKELVRGPPELVQHFRL